jgi:hypothetical protein
MKQNEININAETNVMRVLNNTKRNQIKSIATRPRKALQGNNILVVAKNSHKVKKPANLAAAMIGRKIYPC